MVPYITYNLNSSFLFLRLEAAIISNDLEVVRKYGNTTYLERSDIVGIFLQTVNDGKSEVVSVLLHGGFTPNLNISQVISRLFCHRTHGA